MVSRKRVERKVKSEMKYITHKNSKHRIRTIYYYIKLKLLGGK